MTRAPYIAKEYLEDNNILSKDEINDLLDEYEEVNKIGIPFYNYTLIIKNIARIILLCIAILI